MRETAGDSMGQPSKPPVGLALGPNAPISGNLSGMYPPGPEEQYRKPRVKKKKPIGPAKFDDQNPSKKEIERAREFGLA